jgi:hypothetical protein
VVNQYPRPVGVLAIPTTRSAPPIPALAELVGCAPPKPTTRPFVVANQ